jgi:hypothetical protein
VSPTPFDLSRNSDFKRLPRTSEIAARRNTRVALRPIITCRHVINAFSSRTIATARASRCRVVSDFRLAGRERVKEFGPMVQVLWVVVVVAILAAIWYVKRGRQPPNSD